MNELFLKIIFMLKTSKQLLRIGRYQIVSMISKDTLFFKFLKMYVFRFKQ